MTGSIQHKGSLALGLVLANLSPIVSFSLERAVTPHDPQRVTLPLEVLVSLPVAFFMTFAIGLPLVLALRKHNRLSWLAVCAGTTLAGIALVSVVRSFNAQVPTLSEVFGHGTLYGLVAGLALCVGMWPSRLWRSAPGAS